MPSVVDVKLVTVPVLVLLSDDVVLLTPQHGQIYRPGARAGNGAPLIFSEQPGARFATPRG